MNDTVHGHMVQDLLRHRFGSHDNLICKYSSKYPVQAEREFQRLTNAYIRILNELLKEYLPEIRDAARAERETGQRHDDASDLIAKVKTVFSKMTVELERRTSMFGLRSKIESMAKLTRKLSIREWKKAVKSTLGIDLMDDYYTGELKEVYRKAYSNGPRAKVNCYGANDVVEGVKIMWKENVDVSITGNSTNPTRFQHPVAGTYKKERIEAGKKYFSVASGGGTGRTLHPDNMAAGPASYGMTDTMGRMHSDAQFAGSSSVPAHVEMMGLIGAGNNPMVGMTVAVAVAVEEAAKAGKF